MFWRFNQMCTTNIDSLLNDEGITLQRLMDEDDIIQECKSSNRKLINFLGKTEVLLEMISLVTREPSATTPDAVRFKYNNIAAELFSCDVPTINDAMIADDNLLNELCQFVYEDQPLNPLMASFYSKTMAVLFNQKAEKMIEYLRTKEGFLSQLLKHLKTSAIMDLILKLVTCIENRNLRVDISQWLCSENFVENLLGFLCGNADPEMHGNVAQLLCDLLRNSRDIQLQNLGHEPYAGQYLQSDQDIDPILQLLESKETTELLLDNILMEDLKESLIVHGITVLLTLLELRKPPQLILSEPESIDHIPPKPVITPCIRTTVEAILPRLHRFHEILKDPPQKNVSESCMGRMCGKPVGFVRLQIARLLATLIATGSSEVRKELVSLGTLNLLLDMMIEFSHNNFLHSQIERSIQHILGLEPSDILHKATTEAEVKSESDNSSCLLLVSLIKESRLLQRIMEAWKLNEEHEISNARTRKAYMGHLNKIANYVTDFSKDGKNAAIITSLIQTLPESVRSEWQEFVDSKLSQANKNNEIIPVTSSMVVPRNSSDEEESDIIRIPVPRDTASQEMEAMNKHVTEFGFTDDHLADDSERIKSLTEALTGVASNAGDTDSSSSGDDGDDRKQIQTESFVKKDHLDLLHDSSSDEEDVSNDLMEIDNVNPWPDSSSLKAASDTSDPWGVSAFSERSDPWAGTQGEQNDNWANFSNAEFVNVPVATSPMEVTETNDIDNASNLVSDEIPTENVPDIQSETTDRTNCPAV